ncbi:MAG: GNAT family N-acetyltransferase [Chloroflexota bacterium]
METRRLVIRPLILGDLEDVYQLLDVDLAGNFGSEKAKGREERRQWLEWTVLGYEQLARLYQPPYGERAVIDKNGGRFIGLVGLVPCLAPYEQLPSFAPAGVNGRRFTAEVGLFYAISPAEQRQGYATEAAGALIEFAFQTLRLKRIIATTSYDNAASQAVMRRLGMWIETNPYPDPPWLQVVGFKTSDVSVTSDV